MTGRQRQLLLAAGGAGAALLAAIVFYPRAPAPAGPVADQGDRTAAQPSRQRRDYSPTPTPTDSASLAHAEALARARETPTRLAPRPQPPREIPVGRSGPRPPARTMTGWIADFRDAVCSCKTRSCVGDKQADFIHALDSVAYDAQRDQAAYVEASRQALRCYAALPENS